MRALLITALAALAGLTGSGARAAAPCTPFTSFPLVLNFGDGLNTGTGEDLNCFVNKVQAAVNTLPASVSGLSAAVGTNTSSIATLNGKLGAANGIATLGSDGLLSPAQRPPGSGISTPNYTAAPSISSAPTGNPITTLSTLNVQATTGSESTREFVASFGATSNKGATQDDNSGNGDKVAVYAGTVQQVGSGNAWALNTLTERQSGVTKSTLGYELDINNNDQHLGETLGYAGSVTRPFLYGMEITGVGVYRSTAALSISGPGDHFIWNRGIVFNNNATKQASIQDNTVADISLDIRGGHTYGIDMANMGTVQAPIRMPLQTSIVAGAADSGGARQDGSNLRLIGTDAGGNTRIGETGRFVFTRGALVPESATATLGSAAAPFAGTFTNNINLTPYSPNSTTPCSAGAFAVDASFVYVCTAANTWKRAALAAY